MTAMRAAIIGTGSMAGVHLAALRSLEPRVRVVAALDADATRAAAFCSEHEVPRAYANLAELLETEAPDLVTIATMPALHCRLASECLQGGAHVICEKPLCASLAEWDILRRAERTAERACSCFFPFRFGSGARHVKELMSSRVLGKPLVGVCQTNWYRDAEYFQIPWRGRWETELGGPTMGPGLHALDLFLWLLGDWCEVRAMIGTLDRRIDVEDVSLALVRFENGAMGTVINSALSPRQEVSIRLDFQKATIEARGAHGFRNEDWSFGLPPGQEAGPEERQWSKLPAEAPGSHAAQLRAFLDSLERGRRPLVNATEARRTLELVSALYKSAATGLPVRRGSIGPDDPFYHHVAGTFALDDAGLFGGG